MNVIGAEGLTLGGGLSRLDSHESSKAVGVGQRGSSRGRQLSVGLVRAFSSWASGEFALGAYLWRSNLE